MYRSVHDTERSMKVSAGLVSLAIVWIACVGKRYVDCGMMDGPWFMVRSVSSSLSNLVPRSELQ